MNIALPRHLAALPIDPAVEAERLHHRFIRQALLTPDATAILHRGRQTSYAALDARANQIANRLIARGVRPGNLVGLCLERSADLVATLIAVFKAGAAYVPLDPGYPAERLELMLDESRPQLLVASPGVAVRGGDTIVVEAGWLDGMPEAPPVIREDAGAGALACVFYTSGSTGRPKGVMLGHTATGFIRWSEDCLGRGALARVAATTSICFDPSMFEIFAPLSVGGVVILKRDLLDAFDAEEAPTLLNGVPSAFAELAREHRIPDSVRVINVGGERLSAGLARDLHAQCRGLGLWNHYGPTEATICASAALVPADIACDPPIGQPVADAVFHVLDPLGRPVPDGASGELHIGGPGVAIGYLGRPDLTAERFLPDPTRPGARLYRTGDMVRMTPDGALVFLGREGRQIKFHGFRIELDDIEVAVAGLPGIDAAAVFADQAETGLVEGLRAVVASTEDWTLSRLRRALAPTLPRHMLPNRLVVLRVFPLSATGKIDRQTLAQLSHPAPARLERVDPWLPPLTEAILTLFRDLLAQPAFGPDDDFFEHGGDSLMALDAMLRLGTLLDDVLPASLMAQATTAAALSALIGRQHAALGNSDAEARAVLLRQGAGAPPLFALAPTADRPLQALALATRLGGDRPVYSLVPGRGEGCDALADAMRQIAAVQPSGAVMLLAPAEAAGTGLALASRLETQGRTAFLVLVDAVLPPAHGPLQSRLRAVLDRLPRRQRASQAGRRTLLVSSRPAEGSAPALHGPAERILLPSSGADLMREPAVGQLARLLQERLAACSVSGAAIPVAGEAR